MISYLLLVELHRTQIVIHVLLKCQQENLYHEQNVTHILSISFLTIRAYPTSTLFPYTTLFRSEDVERLLPADLLHDPRVGRVRALEQRLRSEEHTSELQSPMYLVCRLLLEKKKKHYHEQNVTHI